MRKGRQTATHRTREEVNVISDDDDDSLNPPPSPVRRRLIPPKVGHYYMTNLPREFIARVESEAENGIYKVITFMEYRDTILGARGGGEIPLGVVKYRSKYLSLFGFKRDPDDGQLIEVEVQFFHPERLHDAVLWAEADGSMSRYFYSFNYNDEESGFLGFTDAKRIKADHCDTNTPLRVLDLFAGAGGLSFGLHQAGLQVTNAIEYSEEAADNYRFTHEGSQVLVGDTVSIKLALQHLIRDYADQTESTQQFCNNQTPWLPCMDRPECEYVASEILSISLADLTAQIRIAGSDEIYTDKISRVAYSGAWHDWKERPENRDLRDQLYERLRSAGSFGSVGNVDVASSALTRSSSSIRRSAGEEPSDIDSDIEIMQGHFDENEHPQGSDYTVLDFRARTKGKWLYFQLLDTKRTDGKVSWFPIDTVDPIAIRNFVVEQMPSWPLPGQIDVVVGGPPCQDFSFANTARFRNITWWGRNRLVQEWLDWVRLLRPRFAVMENVVGMLEFEEPKLVLAQLISMGYQCSLHVVNSTAYGIPQQRNRVLIFAAKQGELLPAVPKPTHCIADPIKPNGRMVSLQEDWKAAFRAVPVQTECDLPLCPTVKDAINDLPRSQILDRPSFYRKAPENDFQRTMRHAATADANFVACMDHVCTSAAVQDRIDPNSYARTVTATSGKMIGHYSRSAARGLTIREMARFQSFPDCFTFGFTIPTARRQIGNAVPPILGFEIGKAIQRAFLERRLGDHPDVAALDDLRFAHRQWPIASPLWESDFHQRRDGPDSSNYVASRVHLHLGPRDDSSSSDSDDDDDDQSEEKMKSDIDTSDADSEELRRREVRRLNDPRKPFQNTRRQAKLSTGGMQVSAIEIDGEEDASKRYGTAEIYDVDDEDVMRPRSRTSRSGSPKKRKRESKDVNIEDLSIHNSPSCSSDSEDSPKPVRRKPATSTYSDALSGPLPEEDDRQNDFAPGKDAQVAHEQDGCEIIVDDHEDDRQSSFVSGKVSCCIS